MAQPGSELELYQRLARSHIDDWNSKATSVALRDNRKMFTWICPKCGKEVDVAQKSCPHCATPEKPVESAPNLVPPAASSRPAAADAAQAPPTPPRSSMEVRPVHLLIFVGVMILAIGGAVWVSQPDLLSFESVEEPDEGMVETFGRGVEGPFEVAGIRTYYTDDYQTKVKAFVVNHSDQAGSVALRVHLRVQRATESAPPLASFDVILPEPLDGNGSLEIDTGLDAMGSLQSLPPWREIRVDIEPK